MNKNLTKNISRDLNPWSFFKNDLWDVFETWGSADFMPKIEVKDTGKTYRVTAEIPGMNQNDINLTLKDNQLILEGEKKNESKNEDKEKGFYHSEISYGHFYRTIPLGEEVDGEKVSASYRDGVLTVDVEKLPHRQSNSKKIEITQRKLQ